MELKICHLYPDVLNLYGDGGNVICMRQRLQWRGIDAIVDRCCIGDSLHAADYDIFFIGGGQDFEQEVLLQDLGGGKAEEIKAAVRDGKTFLAICGGYQMLGNYYRTWDGVQCDFIGAIDVETIGQKERMIGNYVFTCDELDGQTVVGFENHSGRTYLGSGVRPIGRVLAGNGNNGEDHMEGARVNNLFATYSHGCLLPKNPALADYILKTALEAKFGTVSLAPLDDSLENSAHDYMVKRLLNQK